MSTGFSDDHEEVERVAKAIEAASCLGREGPYGLFDYTAYDDPIPHHVRDFRDTSSPDYGTCVLRTTDADFARSEYYRLTRQHIARAAIAAVKGS